MHRRNLIKQLSALGLATAIPRYTLAGLLNHTHDPEACKVAWKGLSDFAARRYVFRYIEPTKGLPKVFIYGDSISIGYTEFVRESLAGSADIYRLHVNGGDSSSFIHKMETLRKAMFHPFLSEGWEFNWDVIHFNVGLHDLKYIHEGKLNKKEGIQVLSPGTYASNLRKIIGYLQATYPGAKLVFATTTPVPEGEPGRVKGDAARYNEVALDVLKDHGEILVNDLYTFSVPVLEQHASGPGNVHFNSEGQRLQGMEVAKFLGRVLGVEPVDCPPVDEIRKKFTAYEKAVN